MLSPVAQLLPKPRLWMSGGHVVHRQSQPESAFVHQRGLHRNQRKVGDHAPLFQLAGANDGYHDRGHMKGPFSAFNKEGEAVVGGYTLDVRPNVHATINWEPVPRERIGS